MCLCVLFCKLWHGESFEGLQLPKISVVVDRLNIFGFLCFMPKTSSYSERFKFVLTCERNANGNVLTFCDYGSYCESKTVHSKTFSCLLIFSTNPFDHGAYGVRGLNCTLYVRQKYANSHLTYSYKFSVTIISGIPNLTIQWSNNVFSALASSFLGEEWSKT